MWVDVVVECVEVLVDEEDEDEEEEEEEEDEEGSNDASGFRLFPLSMRLFPIVYCRPSNGKPGLGERESSAR